MRYRFWGLLDSCLAALTVEGMAPGEFDLVVVRRAVPAANADKVNAEQPDAAEGPIQA
ncbi:MAG: hypothetical protein ACXWT0_00800 [Methylobacter sp.]